MAIELSEFYARLGSIALIMALGFWLGKRKLIGKETNHQLVNLLLMVFMPASLFGAFPDSYDEASLHLFLAGLVAGVLVMLALIILAKLIFVKGIFRGELRYEAQFAFIFNNATFLGYPIIANTFGATGIIAYCGFIIAFNVALFSYGVYLFERKISSRLMTGIIKNPNILAVMAGMLVFLAGVKLPGFVTDAVGFVGGATTPLSLICIGYMLSCANLRKILKQWKLALTAILQLLVGPVLTYFLLTVLRFPEEVVCVCTLLQALPTATSLGLFATKYGGNEVESSELVTISTVFSLVTMPVMAWVLLG